MNRYYMLLGIVIITLTLFLQIEARGKQKRKGCTGGQKWTRCKGCNATCDPRPVLCPEVCLDGCKCPPRKPIWHNGKCIRKKKCPKCKGGQVYSYCASACDRTCAVPYPFCTEQCVQRCECPHEKPILHNGVCIHEKKCPCPPGQVYNPCGSACNSTCDDPYPICTEQCVPRCQCPSDKPIIDNEQCIEHKDCFNCQGGKVFDSCVLPEPCWPSCENPGGIPCKAPCRPGCKCPSSKPISHNGQCISEKDCDGGCTGGQVWNECGSACNKTCKDPDPACTEQCVQRCECPSDKPILHNGQCIEHKDCFDCQGGKVFDTCVLPKPCWPSCDNPGGIPCKAACRPGCKCPPSKLIWHNGQCMSEKDCDGGCTSGQVWNDCGSACNATCDNPNPICTQQCVPRCECPSEKPILHKGRCIEKKDCCTGGQVWNECGSACNSTCVEPNPACVDVCVPRCECPREKPIIHNGQCIEQKDCCPGGQVWNECGSSCRKTCSNPNPLCTKDCVPRCECPMEIPIWLNYQCVEASECPVCMGGQVWSECGTFCNKTCEEPNPVCPQFFACMGGCDCPADKPIMHNNKCVSEKTCPQNN